MNPQSKYAVDTRRMMCTGTPRQGIRAWPLDHNTPGKELLGRYDMYPNPRGRESRTDPKVDPPPTDAPLTPNVVEVQGVIMRRLNRKTNCGGADLTFDVRTQRNKEKIRDLKLRRALKCSVKRPTTQASAGIGRCNASEVISDDAALRGYLQEPPKLPRLKRKTKPPEGYIRFGPKHVHETIDEFLRAEPQEPIRPRGYIPPLPKVMQIQEELDEAIILTSMDIKKEFFKSRRVGESPETGAASSQAPLIPVVEHQWHASARSPGTRGEARETKSKSPPMRTPRTSSGAGMQYRPKENQTPDPDPIPGPEHRPVQDTGIRTKSRSQPIRKFKPRVGITFPITRPGTQGHAEEDVGAAMLPSRATSTVMDHTSHSDVS